MIRSSPSCSTFLYMFWPALKKTLMEFQFLAHFLKSLHQTCMKKVANYWKDLFFLVHTYFLILKPTSLGSRLVKTLSDRQDLDDELILITEFNKFELQMVMNFCMEGILPLPISQLEKNVPIQISRFVYLNLNLYSSTLLPCPSMGQNHFGLVPIVLDGSN